MMNNVDGLGDPTEFRERASQTAAMHKSARKTKLYDRTGDQITLDEVERIAT
jgi:hypothetical protein